jgi:hypothetical protein
VVSAHELGWDIPREGGLAFRFRDGITGEVLTRTWTPERVIAASRQEIDAELAGQAEEWAAALRNPYERMALL